jgi:uncharacterized protein YqeY
MPNLDLKARIKQDTEAAMRARKADELGVLRMLNAAVKQREVDERIILDDTMLLAIIEKMLKQRRESSEQFKAAGRDDLYSKEQFEIGVLQQYLPPQLSEDEVNNIINAAIAEADGNMGKVMGIIKPKLQGRADLGKVSSKVKELLSSK